MHLLYYWRPDNYRRDRSFGFGYHLNQASPALASVAPGESVWAFTRNRIGQYALAAELVVRAVTRNPANYRYGAYRVWGDLERSRYFDIDRAPGVETLIRGLGVAARARVLAQSFQGHAAVRRIGQAEHELLSAFAASLRELERVGIYPEDEFEARMLLGEEAQARRLDEDEQAFSVRTRYLYDTVDRSRARRHVEWLQELYGGQCQICRLNPRDRYGHRLCHGHHIHWLSRGGEDEPWNLVLVCPTHHAAIHADDAAFDFASLTFIFGNGLVEPVVLNSHLRRAA